MAGVDEERNDRQLLMKKQVRGVPGYIIRMSADTVEKEPGPQHPLVIACDMSR